MSQFGGQIKDHATTALEHVDKADEWANRDGAQWTIEARDRFVDRELRLAQIHATLAVAQQIAAYPGAASELPYPRAF